MHGWLKQNILKAWGLKSESHLDHTSYAEKSCDFRQAT